MGQRGRYLSGELPYEDFADWIDGAAGKGERMQWDKQ